MAMSQDTKSDITCLSFFIATLVVFFTLTLSAPAFFEEQHDTPNTQTITPPVDHSTH